MTDFGPDMPEEWLTAAQTATSLHVTLSRNARPVALSLEGQRLAGPVRLSEMFFSRGDLAHTLWTLVDPIKGVRLTAIRITARDSDSAEELGGCTVLTSALPLKPGQAYALSLPLAQSPQEIPLLSGFAAGTRILTASGKRRIEDLVPGDAIWTSEDGFQPLLWHGVQNLPARGMAAPVRLRRGEMGLGDDLVLAGQQGVRIDTARGPVLVPAAAFVLAGRARRDFGAQVTWHQLLLHGHALIQAHGLVCESLWAPEIAASPTPADWPADYAMPDAPALPRLSEDEGAPHLS
jgi:hypothetical protein